MTHSAKSLQTLIRKCSRRHGDERSQALLDATGEFLRHAAKDRALLSAAIPELALLPPNGAGPGGSP